jgi:hypothetical protein
VAAIVRDSIDSFAVSEGRSNDLFWEGLLLQVEEQRVIPIIGPELLLVQFQGSPVPLYSWVAKRLAALLHVPIQDSDDDYSLNDVVCRHLAARGDVGDVYIALATIMRGAGFAIPEPLTQLASITDFNLYVTTTFDSLLAEALKASRPGVVPEIISYSPKKPIDLPAPKEKLVSPTLYHLFGKVSAAPEYVVSDEDFLEFICRLQAPNYTPTKLFGELESNHLLILGCGFADWLDRFFLRTTKQRKLSDPRDVREVVADRHTSKDRNLTLFLENFSRRTHIFRDGGSVEFVAELWRRWKLRRTTTKDPVTPVGGFALEPEMPAKAIFISYCHEDIEAVKHLYAGLTAAGLPAWFDKSELKPGDEFENVIQRNIERCQLFIPVISANTEAKREGWFRKEWKLATERQDMKAEGEAFVLPLVIDDVVEPGRRVPSRFARLHWSRLPDGIVTPEFASEVLELWKNG